VEANIFHRLSGVVSWLNAFIAPSKNPFQLTTPPIHHLTTVLTQRSINPSNKNSSNAKFTIHLRSFGLIILAIHASNTGFTYFQSQKVSALDATSPVRFNNISEIGILVPFSSKAPNPLAKDSAASHISHHEDIHLYTNLVTPAPSLIPPVKATHVQSGFLVRVREYIDATIPATIQARDPIADSGLFLQSSTNCTIPSLNCSSQVSLTISSALSSKLSFRSYLLKSNFAVVNMLEILLFSLTISGFDVIRIFTYSISIFLSCSFVFFCALYFFRSILYFSLSLLGSQISPQFS